MTRACRLALPETSRTSAATSAIDTTSDPASCAIDAITAVRRPSRPSSRPWTTPRFRPDNVRLSIADTLCADRVAGRQGT